MSMFYLRAFARRVLVAICAALLAATAATISAQQVIDNIDLDGLGKSALVVRSSTTAPTLKAGRYVGNTFVFTDLTDPGFYYRFLGANKIDAGAKSDLLIQNIAQGDFGEVRALLDLDPAKDRYIRNVKRTWDVQAVGDLDGDGFGDLVWRYVVSESPDTGVSYIWFTAGAPNTNASAQNPTNVVQVRKRGGAPLTWTLLGARDLNGDGAADMVYISPDGAIRVLMATPNRTCANLFGGSTPFGFTAQKLANFSGDGRGDILYRNVVTGATQLAKLNATGLTLPTYTGAPDDQNASCTSSALTVGSTAVTLPNSDPTWQLYGVGDYDGNGITDIVWLRPNGQLTLWLMNSNGAAPTEIANAGTAPFTAAATLTGTFKDSAVTGVSYATTSGVTGVTDASGSFRYNPGDTITFTLGTLVLGSATASGVVSPIDIAGGSATKLTNLLVLLQSLDSDGNPANGINITAPCAAAVTAAINLNSTPSVFASAANTALQAAMTAGGLTGSIKTVDQANLHFSTQFADAVAGRIYAKITATSGAMLRFGTNGEYLHGEASPDGFSGTVRTETAGVEYGTSVSVLAVDVNGYNVRGSANVDTNLQLGLSNFGPSERILPQGEALRFGGGSLTQQVENIPGTIIGAWALGSPSVKKQTTIFAANGKFLLVDPNGDPDSPNPRPGVEFGSYTYDPATKILKVSGALYDTNGSNGLLQSAAAEAAGMQVILNADGITGTFRDTTSNVVLLTIYRVSR